MEGGVYDMSMKYFQREVSTTNNLKGVCMAMAYCKMGD
jgi:hypothetical protein